MACSEQRPEVLSSVRAILAVATPAAALNGEALAACSRSGLAAQRHTRATTGAVLASATLQTACIGRLARGGPDALAAFAAASISLHAAQKLFSSLFVVAGTARLSHAVGRRDAAAVRGQAMLNVAACLALGTAAAGMLTAARAPLLTLMRLSPHVRAMAEPLWTLLAAAMPATLANLALSGVIQVTPS